MKKLLIALFVLGIAFPSFAQLKEKDIIGKWNYKIVLDEGVLTGVIKFEKKDGKLAGEVNTDDGEIIVMSKIEIHFVTYIKILKEGL